MERLLSIWERSPKDALSLYLWSCVVLVCSGPIWMLLGIVFSITQPYFTIGQDYLLIAAYPGLIALFFSWFTISLGWVVAPLSWMAARDSRDENRVRILLPAIPTLFLGLAIGPMAFLDLTSIRFDDSESRIRGPLITQSFRTTDICNLLFRSARIGYEGMRRYELQLNLAKPETNHLFHLIPFTGDGQARFTYTPTAGFGGFDETAEQLKRHLGARGFRFSGNAHFIQAAAPDGYCQSETTLDS
ncbi:MAG: hypothetical protein NXI24_24590 [bacterium]|nr:hypothetical protein [bacterium]